MTKRSRKSLKSEKDLKDNQNWQKSSPDSTKSDENTEKEKMLERRRAQVNGVEICPLCGGCIWNLGDIRRCGDCFCDL